jgi:cytochrome P450
MCTTHNVSFDKHPLVLNLIVRLLGGGILFSQTDAVWRKRRSAIAPAFYKGKLVNLVELAKSRVQETHKRWKQLCANGRTRINFMEEVSMMHVKILLQCAFGIDISDNLIDYEHDGKTEKKSVAYVLRTVFHDCINRMADPHIVMFPFLATWHITPYERRLLRNIEKLRDFV